MTRRSKRKKNRSGRIVPAGFWAKNNAALAWFASAFCISTAGVKWFSPDGTFADAVFALAIGGGAAFLGMALGRRIVQALRACRRIAFVSGVVNALLLHAMLTTFIVGLMVGPLSSTDFLTSERMLALAVAFVATATPWGVYWSLREERVRAFFAANPTVV